MIRSPTTNSPAEPAGHSWIEATRDQDIDSRFQISDLGVTPRVAEFPAGQTYLAGFGVCGVCVCGLRGDRASAGAATNTGPGRGGFHPPTHHCTTASVR